MEVCAHIILLFVFILARISPELSALNMVLTASSIVSILCKYKDMEFYGHSIVIVDNDNDDRKHVANVWF